MLIYPKHLRNNALQYNSLYPSYHIVKKAKNKCYPENIQISDYSTEVPLQDLLFHVASRIFSAYSIVLKLPVLKDCTRLILIYKAAFDSATGESVYKQQLDDMSELNTDELLFITCLVPLELYCFKDKKQVVWRNPKPSSTSYCICSPRFKYRKESKEVVLKNMSQLYLFYWRTVQ